MVRSVMEGIAFTIGNCFEVIENIARGRNESIQTIRTGEGGGSRLGVWRQIICDVLSIPLEVVRIEEPGCLGAALLAGVGVREYEDIQTAVGRTTHIDLVTSPDAKNTALYEARRSVFNETYQVLEPVLYQQIDREE